MSGGERGPPGLWLAGGCEGDAVVLCPGSPLGRRHACPSLQEAWVADGSQATPSPQLAHS